MQTVMSEADFPWDNEVYLSLSYLSWFSQKVYFLFKQKFTEERQDRNHISDMITEILDLFFLSAVTGPKIKRQNVY